MPHKVTVGFAEAPALGPWQDEITPIESPLRSCRVCGCTETSPCLDGIEPCHWAEADLCSACQGSDHG